MGASEFILKQRGKNVSDAFKQAYDDAEEEHGHEQGYSGAINCTSLPGLAIKYFQLKLAVEVNDAVGKQIQFFYCEILQVFCHLAQKYPSHPRIFSRHQLYLVCR